MTREQERIRLAEFCGLYWQQDEKIKEWPNMGHWYYPDGKRVPHSGPDVRGCGSAVPPEFRPDTNANDCEAVIRALNERGIIVEVEWEAAAQVCVSISIWSGNYMVPATDDAKDSIWCGDDWKLGVCELALKVLENSNDS